MITATKGANTTPKKRGKADKRVGKMITARHSRGIPVIKRGVPQPGITKKEFIEVLTKAGQPVEHETEPDSENSET